MNVTVLTERSALLDAVYFIPIIYNAYFKKPENEDVGFDEASPLIVVPLSFTAAMSVALFLFPNFLLRFYDFATLAMKNVLGN